MKPLSEILHKTPWWALLLGGVATFAALAVFVTPYHIIQYRDEGTRSEEESRAIKREIDNTFAENAINVGRGVLRGMLARTTDPDRREELEQALQGLEEARVELREAGAEVQRAKQEALAEARKATAEFAEAVAEARQAQDAATGREERTEARARLREAERQLQAAKRRERAAERDAKRGATITIGPSGSDKPAIEIEIEREAGTPPPSGAPGAAIEEAKPPAVPAPPATAAADPKASAEPQPPTLPPDVARKIRRDVTGDMYRIGIGAALLLILFPLFILAIIAKFFIDRSRASLQVADAKRREADYARMSQQVTEAKLAALQAQVEPHFLYNTLASVQALTEVDPAKASEMTGHLIQYLRNALPKMRESVSTVGQEVELVRAYLSILQMRMGARLAFSIAVPESLASLPFPPLMLPSLVENAIKHGLEPMREGGTVHISADQVNGRLRLVVADTGRGFAETVGAGVGLANIRERLAALYGDAARLTLEANTPRGVIAAIEVPASGTRAGAAAASAASAASSPGAARSAGAPSAMPDVLDATPARREGFWGRTWEALVAIESIWRRGLYYLYLVLLGVAAVVAVAALIGVGTGALPIDVEGTMLTGPVGVPFALAGLLIALVLVAAVLALVMLVLYALGFFLLAVLVFVLLAVLLGLSPVIAPVALVALFVWWMARRRKREAPGAVRVEPTIAPRPPEPQPPEPPSPAPPPPVPPEPESGR